VEDCSIHLQHDMQRNAKAPPVIGPRYQFPLGSLAFPLFLFYERTTGAWDTDVKQGPGGEQDKLHWLSGGTLAAILWEGGGDTDHSWDRVPHIP